MPSTRAVRVERTAEKRQRLTVIRGILQNENLSGAHRAKLRELRDEGVVLERQLRSRAPTVDNLFNAYVARSTTAPQPSGSGVQQSADLTPQVAELAAV
jgi:hypothetical protein